MNTPKGAQPVGPSFGPPDKVTSINQGNWRNSGSPGGSSSDGGGGSNLEPRIAKLEANVEHIQTGIADIKQDVREIRGGAQTDFRILFGALILTAIGLAWLMAVGFKWLPW